MREREIDRETETETEKKKKERKIERGKGERDDRNDRITHDLGHNNLSHRYSCVLYKK